MYNAHKVQQCHWANLEFYLLVKLVNSAIPPTPIQKKQQIKKKFCLVKLLTQMTGDLAEGVYKVK